MPPDELNDRADYDQLSEEDQYLIDRIKLKIADGKTVTLMQEKHGHQAQAYPPTPLHEIEAAEAALGFRFPSLMREIWLQVGNGGFGPGYGITGVETGEQIYGYSIVELKQLRVEYEQDDTEAKISKQQLLLFSLDDFEVIQPVDKSIDYCYWGCNVTTLVDCSHPNLPIHTMDGIFVKPHTSKTLRQFWQDWLDGTVEQY